MFLVYCWFSCNSAELPVVTADCYGVWFRSILLVLSAQWCISNLIYFMSFISLSQRNVLVLQGSRAWLENQWNSCVWQCSLRHFHRRLITTFGCILWRIPGTRWRSVYISQQVVNFCSALIIIIVINSRKNFNLLFLISMTSLLSKGINIETGCYFDACKSRAVLS